LFMSWAYLHVGRLEDILAVLDAAEEGPITAAVRYAAEITIDVPRAQATVPPALSGGPLDALVSLSHYAHGRLSELADVTMSPWVQAVVTPYRVGALRALGQTERALAIFDAAPAGAAWRQWVGPELLLDAGRADEARALAVQGRAWAQASGSTGFEGFIGIAEAKLALRVDRDPVAARAILDRIEALPRARALLIVGEMLDCWYGLALLRQGRDAEALERLDAAVASMTAGDRILELPTAATFLAEARWRTGDEHGADEAADLALAASRRQGSNHLLLQALADVPAVLSRRLDAEPAADSPWHVVARAFAAQGAELPEHRPLVHLAEFGRRVISVGGEDVKPRLNKTYELLAFLVAHHDRECGRDELLDALFDGRRDDSTRAHLRQAMQWLRQLLPGDDPVPLGETGWRLGDDVRVVTESSELEARLTQAARLQGEERLTATMSALQTADRGEYLPGARSAWADERAGALAALVTSARLDAAELAYALGRLDDAGQLAGQVLESEPYREVAWRVQMRIASALGDDDGVLRAFTSCERALAEVGATPSPTTQGLLTDLRR
ncbi:MAG TPA: BTAD domain-containing putative transcriptional regulator, partial [Solirubrobacteraceae bacterium]